MPLVSVVMPLFNAANTLLLALASLEAQTYENWECIVVDDGSTDNPEQIIAAFCDPRIQYQRLARNQGRGYARQWGLEIARGKYIAFLDADDWVYPDKLREQKELLESEPDVALVSTGMAISNANDQLVGVRNASRNTPVIRAPMKHLAMPPFAFAPSMIVAELAKKTGFDRSFPIAEDVDFLLRAISGKPYAVLPSPLYVYREQDSTTLPKVKSALDHCCRMFAKQFYEHPLASTLEIAKARGKQGIYCSAHAFGLWGYMISRRSQTPNMADSRQFQSSFKYVSETAARHTAACPVG